ncbi:MAG: TIGR01777 family oxidoreductase [Ilyomonas sp.]
MATVLLTGGTGMIGRRLSEMLRSKGYDVIILTRKTSLPPPKGKLSYANWDEKKGLIDTNAIAKADHIIHLAGANVAEKRWTKKRKAIIQNSRTASSALLVKALKENSNKVRTVVSASAIGWYGPDTQTSKQKGFKENAPSATDFLGTTCKLWEQSISPVQTMGKRLVILRTGIVLSNDGGALVEFKKPLKTGIAAILGSGKQAISWIHMDDLCRMYIYALEKDRMNGSYNAVAFQPTTTKKFTLVLAKQLRGKSFITIRIPSFVLKIVLGEMSVEVLKSTTVNADKIKNTGFTFLYPFLQEALENLAGKEKKLLSN